MPFYFALPRTGNTSSQGRQVTGRTEYIRTAPTTLTFTTDVPLTRFKLHAMNNIHALAMSAFAGEQSGDYNKFFKNDCTRRLLFPSVHKKDIIPITLPKMSFRFGNLTEAQIDRLDALGMEERNVKGKGKVWVGALTGNDATEVMSFGVQSNYAAMGGTVSVHGVRVINQILRIITLAAQTITLANMGKEAFAIHEFGLSQTYLVPKAFTCSTMSDVPVKDGKITAYNSDPRATDQFCTLQPLPKVTGTISDLQDLISRGIFLPFEPNYSQTDRRAIHSLLADFSQICSESDDFEYFDKDLVDVWTSEICLTMEGEFMAHMISSLCLAKKVGARICFLVTGNLYEGAILHGSEEFSFKLVGGTQYVALERDALIEDVAKYAFHSTTLYTILQEVGFGEDVDVSKVKTMRQLRSLVMGHLGHALTPIMEASLAKQLVFLNFREKPEPVNPATLSKFFSFIHPSTPAVIPESVYMDRRAFFSKDPTELALSMFGMYAPSPIIHGQTLNLAVSPSSTKRSSNEPPAIQFCLKELSVSAKDWEGFIRGGAIVQPSQKIRRGRRFAGTDKSQIWGQMASLAAAGISSKKNETVASRADKEGEKREREDGQDPFSGGKKMKFDAVDFSVFGNSM